MDLVPAFQTLLGCGHGLLVYICISTVIPRPMFSACASADRVIAKKTKNRSRPSVRPLFPFYILNQLTFDCDFENLYFTRMNISGSKTNGK